VFVRARAVSRPATPQAASWNLQVRNNTNGNALYVLDGNSFYSCVVNQTRNLRATTGWGGGFAGEYTGTRAAAPFAILDTLYAAARFVIEQGDAGQQLPALNLNAYWSEDNVPATLANGALDVANGLIDTTLYQPAGFDIPAGVYVLGAEDNDTDEFDQHVLAHEFQHYLEDALGRTDSVGGDHSLGERLDMRVAFSEGYANAFSAMVLGDTLYRDSGGASQGDDLLYFDVEEDDSLVPGWYSEASVQRIAWDLFDDADGDGDPVSIDFGLMLDVFRNELSTGVPQTSLFAFITALKQRAGVPDAAVDNLVQAEGVEGTSLGINSVEMNAYATEETHSGVAQESEYLVLPVYDSILVPGTRTVCASSEIQTRDGLVVGVYNKLGNRRLLRFNLPDSRLLDITVSCDDVRTCGGSPAPDPDFVVSRGNVRTYAETVGEETERLQDFPATAGDYVLEVYDWSHVDRDEDTPRGPTCMTVTIQ
jgi:hypothetical protein